MLGSSHVISLIPVRDADRAREFYESKLGLRFIDDDGFALVFEAGGRFLRLTVVDELSPQPFSIIAWQVADMAAQVADLQERGVACERYDSLPQDDLGIWTVPDGSAKVAWFRDPDGNVLSLVESANDQP